MENSPYLMRPIMALSFHGSFKVHNDSTRFGRRLKLRYQPSLVSTLRYELIYIFTARSGDVEVLSVDKQDEVV